MYNLVFSRFLFFCFSIICLLVPIQPGESSDCFKVNKHPLELKSHSNENEDSIQEKYFSDLIGQDRAILKKMSSEPADFYFELREIAKKAIGSGAQDFGFGVGKNPLVPILKRISGDARLRLTRKFGDKFENELKAIIKKADKLLESGDPLYKASIRFIMNEYLPVLDKIFAERHPELSSNEYHRHHASHLLEEFLSKASDIIIMFSFEPVDFAFFLDSRSVPLQLVGINFSGLDDRAFLPHADKYDMKPSEFAWHDFGHIEFMAYKDIVYLEKSGKNFIRVIQEWDATKRKLRYAHNQVKSRDPDLYDAMEFLLAELLHERGFQYALTVLKQELDTPKWVEVVLRKRDQGFFNKVPHNPRLFDRLLEAQKLLLYAVEKAKETGQINWLKATQGDNGVFVKITQSPSLGFDRGHLSAIEIHSTSQVEVSTITESRQSKKTLLPEITLAQVNPVKKSILSKGVIRKIEHLLYMKSRGIAANVKGTGELVLVKSVVIEPSENAVFVLRENGNPIQLDGVEVAGTLPRARPKFLEREIFEMNQVLGTFERNEILVYTTRQPEKSYVGTLTVENHVLLGKVLAQIKTSDGNVLELPLSELRIDPVDPEVSPKSAKRVRAKSAISAGPLVQIPPKCSTEGSKGYPARNNAKPIIQTNRQFDPDQDYTPVEYLDPNMANIGLPSEGTLKSFEGKVSTDAGGRPLNPRHYTGITNRGKLFSWGANFAADAVLTRYNPNKKVFEMLLIKRADTGAWAIPGGFQDRGESPVKTALRELLEETGVVLDGNKAVTIYEGYVDDPRNTDNSWMETTVVNISIPFNQVVSFRTTIEAPQIKWETMSEEVFSTMYASHGEFAAKTLKFLTKNKNAE